LGLGIKEKDCCGNFWRGLVISVIRPVMQKKENEAAMQKKKYKKYRRSWIDGPVMRLHAGSLIEGARVSSIRV
jgi:hypothetical protein